MAGSMSPSRTHQLFDRIVGMLTFVVTGSRRHVNQFVVTFDSNSSNRKGRLSNALMAV